MPSISLGNRKFIQEFLPKNWERRESNPGQLGEKRKRYLWAILPSREGIFDWQEPNNEIFYEVHLSCSLKTISVNVALLQPPFIQQLSNGSEK